MGQLPDTENEPQVIKEPGEKTRSRPQMGKPAFSGLREAWLKEKLTKYVLVKPVDRNAFVADTIRCFLKRFPVSLGDNEPTEESLNSVDNCR